MTTLGQELVRKQESLAADRATYESHCQEIAKLVLPRQDQFFNERNEPGERRTSGRYDDTAVRACSRHAAIVEGLTTPRREMWHGFVVPGLGENQEAMEWCDSLKEFVFARRYSTLSNFASQMHECYMALGAFGTACLEAQDTYKGRLRYRASHISEHHIMEDMHGLINANYRKYRLTARQAAEKFKNDFEKLPGSIKKAVDKENQNERFDFLHVVLPDESPRALFPFKSYHVAIDGSTLLAEGGFKTFPYIFFRYVTAPGETYGRSPAMECLATIKQLNSMIKTDAGVRHRMVEPALLAASRQTVRKVVNKPGHINYGGLDAAGRPLVQPLNSGAQPQASMDLIQRADMFINSAFLVDMLQVLRDGPQITATEALQRAQEMGMIMTPIAGRLEEGLGALIRRELSIYQGYGAFDDDGPLAMPDSVKGALGPGGLPDIEYTSPVAKMQKAESGTAVTRTLEALLPLAELAPELLQRVDWRTYGDTIRDAMGAPADLYKRDEELQAEQEAQAQAQAMQQMMGAAPQVAGAIKDIAHAQQMARS
jgi:hypothetical protein